MDSEKARFNMVEQQIRTWDVLDQKVLDLLLSLKREAFVPKASRALAFADLEIPLVAGGKDGAVMLSPKVEARILQEVAPRHADKVLEVGTGSGYQTAILSKLAAEVFSVERVKPLLDQAWERLMDLDCRNVHFRFGDGSLGWREAAPFDRILFTAGAPQVPQRMLLEQLIDGGIAILPIGPEDQQVLVRVTRHGDDLDRQDICACRFVKLIGEHGWSAPTE